MELNPNHIVCACRNKTILDVLNYIEDNRHPVSPEQIDKLMKDCNIGQACRKCVMIDNYDRIDIDLNSLLDEL